MNLLVWAACYHFYASEDLTLFDTDGLIYYEDLMEESSLQSSLNILEKDYDDAIRNKAELDERVFINEEDSLLGSGSLSGGSLNNTGTKVSFNAECTHVKCSCSNALWFLLFCVNLIQ